MEGAMGISTDGAFGEVPPRDLELELRFSTLCVIQSLVFIYLTRFLSNMLLHYSVLEQLFTVQSSELNSKKGISSE
jgi:hypothetical protein